MPSLFIAPLLQPYLCVELAAPAFMPVGPRYSFFLDSLKLGKNYSAEMLGVFVLYTIPASAL